MDKQLRPHHHTLPSIHPSFIYLLPQFIHQLSVPLPSFITNLFIIHKYTCRPSTHIIVSIRTSLNFSICALQSKEAHNDVMYPQWPLCSRSHETGTIQTYVCLIPDGRFFIVWFALYSSCWQKQILAICLRDVDSDRRVGGRLNSVLLCHFAESLDTGVRTICPNTWSSGDRVSPSYMHSSEVSTTSIWACGATTCAGSRPSDSVVHGCVVL